MTLTAATHDPYFALPEPELKPCDAGCGALVYGQLCDTCEAYFYAGFNVCVEVR